MSDAASYNLQLSTISSSVTYTTTDTTYRVNGLAKLTNYTWKVEAINAGGTSYYTGGFTFTTVPAAPAAPSLLAPASAAAGVNRAARFIWRSSLNANKYRLQIASGQCVCHCRDRYAGPRYDGSACNSAGWRTLTTTGVSMPRITAAPVHGRQPSCSRPERSLQSKRSVGVPTVFEMYQNYPNPFNPSTVIRYDVPSTANVKVVIYDILGREVNTLVNGALVAGRYNVTWNASGLATGVYIYRMEAAPADGSKAFTSVKKLLLMK